MAGLLHDLRFATRTLLARPAWTALIVLTLALGIGANTAIFSVVGGVLLRPLPYPATEELVVLQQHRPQAGVSNQFFTIHEVHDYQEMNRTLENVVEHHTMYFNLIGNGEPERVQTGVVSAEFFDVLGVQPMLGRSFVDADDELDAEPVLVLTYEYWQRSHGGDPNVVGKTFEMNDQAHTVVGIMPPFPQYPSTVAVYMPTNACPFRANAERANTRGAFRALTTFARSQPGVTRDEINADVARIAASLRAEYPDFYPGSGGYEANAAGLFGQLTDGARPTLMILLATAGFVLLIVCANVANLTLARLLQRDREMAVRTALGASRGRLVRQQITESTLLALAGGLLGLGLANAGLQVLVDFAAGFTPRAHEISLDGMVLGFTLVISLGTGIVAGLLPILSERRDLTRSLKAGGERGASAGHHRLRGMLVTVQLAVSFVLLIGAGLMIRSLTNLQAVDLGVQSERVLTMQIALDWSRYTSPQDGRRFWSELLAALNEHPQVRSAAQGTNFPLGGGLPQRRTFIESNPVDDPEFLPVIDYRSVSPRYFDTLGIEILGGRDFDARDETESAPVAIINSTMAETYWPSRDPLGERISNDGENWRTIVGVVGDVKQRGLDQETMSEIYVPLNQGGFGNRLLVATVGDPAAMVRTIREEVYKVDPNQPISFVQTLAEVRSDALASPRLMTTLLSMFAGLALAVSLAGISGLIAFAVNQRTREIGIRMALGAQRTSVLGMVVRQGMLLVGVGLAVGILCAVLLSGFVSGLIFGVESTDPFTYVGVATIFLIVALVACLLPARRATSIDPMIALRSS